MEKGELLSYEVNNKDVFKAETKEEEQDFFPPKKVLITSFFKEVFRSLFHFKTRLITSIIILFLSLTSVIATSSIYLRGDRDLIISGLMNYSPPYTSIGLSDIPYSLNPRRRFFNHSFNSFEDYQMGLPIYCYTGSKKTLKENYFAGNNALQTFDDWVISDSLQEPVGYASCEKILGTFSLLYGKEPDDNECLISSTLFHTYERFGYKDGDGKALNPNEFTAQKFLALKPIVQSTATLKEVTLTISGVYDDGFKAFYERFKDVKTVDDDTKDLINQYVSQNINVLAVNQNTLQDVLTLPTFDTSFPSIFDDVIHVGDLIGYSNNFCVTKANEECLTLKEGEGIYLPILRFFLLYSDLDFVFTDDYLFDLDIISSYFDTDSGMASNPLIFPFSSLPKTTQKTMKIGELENLNLSLLAALSYVSKYGIPDNFRDAINELAVTLNLQNPSEDTLKTVLAYYLYGKNAKESISSLIKDIFQSIDLVRKLEVNLILPGRKGLNNKLYDVVGVDLTTRNTLKQGDMTMLLPDIYVTSSVFNEWYSIFYQEGLLNRYCIPLKDGSSISTAENFVNQLNEEIPDFYPDQSRLTYFTSSYSTVASNAFFWSYLNNNVLLTIILFGVLFFLISLLFSYNFASYINKENLRNDAVKISLGMKQSSIFKRNFAIFTVLYLLSSLLFVIALPLLFLLLNNYFTSKVFYPLTYFAYMPGLFFLLMVIYLLFISLVIYLQLKQNQKKLMKALKESFH